MNAALWKHFEGQWVDAFLLRDLLGAGGFGAVFLADHIVEKTIIRKDVALKLILTSAEQTDRHLQELIAATTLRHPHIVECFHAGSTTLEGTKLLYLVMELAEATLQVRLSGTVLASQAAEALGQQMASALVYLHERKRVHRDLKPGNVLRVGDAWKLSDFGSVRQTTTDHTGVVMGTVRYMPPESFEGMVSPAWDTWSLGVLLLEALTGQGPFGNLTEGKLLFAIHGAEPSIPGGLAAPFGDIVRGCLTRDPKARWTAQQVLRKFREHRIAQEADTERAASPSPHIQPAAVPGYYFVSHAMEDADFGLNLAMQLNAGVPAIKTWLAQQDLQVGESADDQIEQAIESCESFLFVMSRTSVTSGSGCRIELKYALQSGKPVIPLMIEPGVKVPLTLSNLKCVDFTGDFSSALAQLRRQITAPPSSSGALSKLKKELAEAELAMSRAWRPGLRAELRNEIQQLKTEIALQEVVARDPQGPGIAAARQELNDMFDIIESGVSLGEGICALLSKAIHHGAPIYNLGSHIGCAVIYDYAAKLVFRLLERPEGREKLYLAAGVTLRQVSFDAISPEVANQRAWQLRHAFDAILETLIPAVMGTKTGR